MANNILDLAKRTSALFFGGRADYEICPLHAVDEYFEIADFECFEKWADGLIPVLIASDEEFVVYAHHLDLFLS